MQDGAYKTQGEARIRPYSAYTYHILLHCNRWYTQE